MSGILNSGKIATLLSRLTAARAGYLDTINTNLDATISSRPAGSDYTAARAAKLDNLDAAVSSAGAKPPTTNGLKGVGGSNSDLISSWVVLDSSNVGTGTASEASYDTWETLLEETSASGILQILGVKSENNSSDRDAQVRLTIDGNVVWTSDTNLFQGDSTDSGKGLAIVGIEQASEYIAPESIPFSSSFKLDFKKTENAVGTVELRVYYRYYVTG